MAPYRVETSFSQVTPSAAGSPPGGPESLVDPYDSAFTWRSSGLILVVDDEPSVAKVTGMVLDQCGFSVDVATSGDDALRHIERLRDQLRLVLVDLTMPDKSGIEVMNAARSLGITVPMVLTSGYPKEEAGVRFMSAGFSGYLQKPYRLETLIAVLKDALGE